MAGDKQVARAAKRKLEEMLMEMSEQRSHLAAYHNIRDAFGVKRFERLLKANYSLIREHCARHDLELPHDVPPENAA